jgi:cell wall-associated NlpC family hydrolase
VRRSLAAQQLHVADRPTGRDRTIADRSEQAAQAARLAAERAAKREQAEREQARREQAAREQAKRDQASREQAKRKRTEREQAQRERAAKRERAKERQRAQERDAAHHRDRADRRERSSRSSERSSRSSERSSRHSDSPARAGAPGSRSFGDAVLGIAARYEGTMYVYGGTTPAGFDCSGYTSYVMRKVGISLPRTSGAQRAATRRVSRGDAVPGDLVFMPGHVGIYAGNGRMWDAPRTGKAISKRTIWSGSATFGRVG